VEATTGSVQTKQELWTRVLEALGPEVRPCVLHNYRTAEELLKSDVDCVLPRHQLPRRVAQRLHSAGLTIIQYVRYEATAHTFIVSGLHWGSNSDFLRLDVASDFRYSRKPVVGGRLYLTEEELLRSQQSFDDFMIPTPEIEFVAYFIKRVAKGDLSEEHGTELSELFSQNPSGCQRIIARYLGRRSRMLVSDAAARGDWGEVRARIGALRSELLRRSALLHPLRVLGYWVRDADRLAERWLRPAGLWVILAGGDEGERAAVADRVADILKLVFNGTVVSHGILKEPPRFQAPNQMLERPVQQLSPLHVDCRSSWRSRPVRAFKSWFGARRDLAQGKLLVTGSVPESELVCPADPGWHPPGWRAWASRVCPRPDLVVLLDVPTHVIRVNVHQAHGALSETMPYRRVVDISQPPNRVAAEVAAAIVERLTARTSQRLRLDGSPGSGRGLAAMLSVDSHLRFRLSRR
jgi:hypothetical protein